MAEPVERTSDPSESGAPRYWELVAWAAILWASDAVVDYLIGISPLDGTWAATAIGGLYMLVAAFAVVLLLSKRHGLFGKDSYRLMRDVLIIFAINYGIGMVLDPVLFVLSLR